MKPPILPPIQGKRFDIEVLPLQVLSLAKSASKGPTYLRSGGRISWVVMTETVFNEVWPDPRRAWSTDEMPFWAERLLLKALQTAAADTSGGED
ncbi:hypothetical protein GCM10016455_23160 [Aliiroseovarius zhejiangensis]|uniref:Uncharacterized protein n=1 Tax=Aliiroseovarius zhejiangensis TaxID=1632025 RepID=A0ABQ3J1S4_9RHOB|nr:hypothetical protein [Aliiroseovarius zhejiangensis]GHF01561.1 hypothetical protein GCM10016455_23160 [Aliiroseovarius zhejiangensis]